MAYPDLLPANSNSISTLTSTGSVSEVAQYLSFGIYASSPTFLSGAADQVSYVYNQMGGQILDIELHRQNVYTAYEDAVLEYSYLMNIHQAKNSLGDILGATTGTFDHDGEIVTGEGVELKFPKFTYAYGRNVGHAIGGFAGVGGYDDIYSSSFSVNISQQDYDLQKIVSSSFPSLVGNKRILVRKVYYITPQATWRFFGYYGTINVVGNLSTYGQFSDDSTFEIIPVWQNKLQAMAYSDALYTRYSHYSYRIRNNKLRLYPMPTTHFPTTMWMEFSIPSDPWDEDADKESGVNGVNNMNTAPFANISYEHINSIGKHWIRRYALSIAKGILGGIREKIKSGIPIPGDTIQLNGSELISQSVEEKEKLREELKTVLDELTYEKLSEIDAKKSENSKNVLKNIPMAIYRG